LNFEKEIWHEQILPFTKKSIEEKKEYLAQLCKKNNKVSLGKTIAGDVGRVEYNVRDMQKCDEGEFIGTMHVETIPHKPTFPSDDDIHNDFNNLIKNAMSEKGEETCLCSEWMEGNPNRGKYLVGCYCEKWTPWKKEDHEKVIKKIYPYSYLWFNAKKNELIEIPEMRDMSNESRDYAIQHGIGFWYLYEDLIDLGIITDRQLQWYERQIKDGKIDENGMFRSQKFSGKSGIEKLKEMHLKFTGLPWRAFDTHDKFMKLVKQGKISRKER